MKKLFTLLLLTITAFIFKTQAQPGTACNADFNFTISGFTVNFTAVVSGDPLINHHYWKFGDGSVSSDVSPVHVYAAAGTYSVKHIIYRGANTGMPTCIDSAERQVVILSTVACNLHAKFSFERDPQQPNKVYFTNLSTPANDIHYTKWSFGDGTYSNDFNATHTFANSGVYNVCLLVRRDANSTSCGDDTCMQIQIQVPTPIPCNLNAKFSFQRDPQQPNKVYFTNLSTPANDIHYTKWSFGDGTYSNDFNATHTFANYGAYTVCLLVKREANSSCGDDTCILIQIQLPPPSCNLVANFVSYPDSQQLNKIHFLNLSIPLAATDSVRWTFGDGTSSAEVNPTHIYTTPGTYTVCLRVKKNNSPTVAPCVREICKQIEVHAQCNLEANFSWHPEATNSNKIYFNNLSTPASAVLYASWTFGDGTTSTTWNPDHTYAHAGTYNVCLKISGSNNCYREICKQVTVVEPAGCLDISKFTFSRSTANCLEFKFEPVYKNPNWQYHWTFGDGTGSNDMNAHHTYAHSGNYTVCLTVYKSADCASTTCKTVETGTCFSCSNVWVNYEYTRDAAMPNKLYFHALSNYPILSQTWTFTKLTPNTGTTVTLVQNNPTYVFHDTGYYRVCLKAITYGGCVKEYCQVIHITHVGDRCTLQAYPNPAHNQVSVNVQLAQPEVIHVYIYNSLNILVKQKDQQGSTGNNIVTVNIESLIPGAYAMKVVYGNHVCYSQFQKL